MRLFTIFIFPLLLNAQDFDFNAYTTIKELRFFEDLKKLGGGEPYKKCMQANDPNSSIKEKDFDKSQAISDCILLRLGNEYEKSDIIDLFKNQYNIGYYVGQNKADNNKEYLLKENIKNMITRNLQTQGKDFADLSSVSRVDQLKVFKELAKKNRDLYFSEFCLLNKDASDKTHEKKIIEAMAAVDESTEKASLQKCRDKLKADACNKNTLSASGTSAFDSRACRYKEIINKYSSAVLKVDESIKKLQEAEGDPKLVINALKNQVAIDHSKITEIDGKNDEIAALLDGGKKVGGKDYFDGLVDELQSNCAGNTQSDNCKKLLTTGDVEQYNQLQLKITLEAALNKKQIEDIVNNNGSDKEIEKFVIENNYYTAKEFEALKKNNNPAAVSKIILKYFENRKNSLIKDLNDKFANRVTSENESDISNITEFIKNKKKTLTSLFEYNEITKKFVKDFKPKGNANVIMKNNSRAVGNSSPNVDLDDFYIDIFSN